MLLFFNRFTVHILNNSDCALNQQLGVGVELLHMNFLFLFFHEMSIYGRIRLDIQKISKNPFKNLVYTFFSRSTFFLHQNQMVSVHRSVFSPLPRNMGKWYCLIYLFKIVCIFFKPPRKKNLCSWMFRVNSAFRVGSRMFMFNWTVTVLRLTRAAFEIDLITIYFRN